MRFSSALDVSRHQETFFSLLCVLVVLVAAIGSTAQTPASDPDEDSTDPTQQKDPVRPEDPKKIAKYDVNRIGHRGIGHGFNIYSQKREHQLGQNLAAAFDSSSRIVNDPVLNDYVNRLPQKILRNSDAEIPFTVRLIDSSEIPRAYGLPGGFLYVDSALIFAAESEAELAGVIAHEIAHVAARHATRALTRKDLFHVTGSLSMLAGPVGIVLQDAGGVAGPLSVKKFSRDSEYEADLLGIEYAYTAGYDPQALLDALEKLHAIEVKRDATFAQIPGYHMFTKLPFHGKIARSFASYPLTDERIQRLQSEISVFLPTRKDYVLDTDEFQQVKSLLLASRSPVLRRHNAGDDDNKGPVLRRSSEFNPDTRAVTGLPMTVTLL